MASRRRGPTVKASLATAGNRRLRVASAARDPGEPARESEVCDLLVLGSRGYGPAGAVTLGDVSDALLRSAACPAIVLPNGVTPELFPECGKVPIDSAA